MKSKMYKCIKIDFFLMLVFILSACGGGGGGDNGGGEQRLPFSAPTGWHTEAKGSFKFAYDPAVWQITYSSKAGATADDIQHNYEFKNLMVGVDETFLMTMGNESIATNDQPSDDSEVVVVAGEDETYRAELPTKNELISLIYQISSDYDISIFELNNNINFVTAYAVQDSYQKMTSTFDVIKSVSHDDPIIGVTNEKIYDFVLQAFDMNTFPNPFIRMVFYKDTNNKAFVVIMYSDKNPDRTEINDILKHFTVVAD